ncbi:MAG: hypothetical protein KGO51_03020 [Alphaproteobacteria bacterium]|nr:hypothetical protein [Alphaproteobacteria bacterium]
MDRPKSFLAAAVGAAAAATLVAIGAAAVAQERMVPETKVEAPMVIGHRGPPPEGPQGSYPAGFRDLGLRSETGKKTLEHRLAITATFGCDKLGGRDRAAWTSCRDQAFGDGM